MIEVKIKERQSLKFTPKNTQENTCKQQTKGLAHEVCHDIASPHGLAKFLSVQRWKGKCMSFPSRATIYTRKGGALS